MPFVTFPSSGPYAPTQLTTDLNTNFNDAQTQLNALDTRLDAVEPQLVTLDNRLDIIEAGGGATSTLIVNKIINGCMRIDQRNNGAVQTFTAGAALAYAVDRWYGYCTGANVTGQQVTINGANRYRFTGAASNTGVGFGQRIEAANSFDMAGQSARLQIKAASSSLTTLNWAVYYATTNDSFGTLAAPTRTLITSGSFTISATENTYISPAITIPSAATTGIEIVFTGGALLASQTLTLGDVQFEIGSTASPFRCRLLGQELALCQRYFQVAFMPTNTYGGQFSNATFYGMGQTIPVTMRVVPTGTYVFVNFNQYWVYAGSTILSTNSATGLSVVTTASTWRITQPRNAAGTTPNSGDFCIFEAQFNIQLSAEL